MTYLFRKIKEYRREGQHTGVFTGNNGPNNVPMQPNKHTSQISRYSLFFNQGTTTC
jgi:hypothetical protein